MEVLVIRHAIAELRAEEGGNQPDDRLRELTGQGRRRMKRGARGLRSIKPEIQLLASSPLVRAVQTAEIVAKAYEGIEITETPALSPGAGVDSVVRWLRTVESSGTVAVVGHEPDLGELVTHLLTGRPQRFIEMGKGGACLLELTSGVSPGEAVLVWHLAPKQLRELGRRD